MTTTAQWLAMPDGGQERSRLAPKVVSWKLNPIPPGGSTYVELFVRVSDALTVGYALTNTALVTRTTIPDFRPY